MRTTVFLPLLIVFSLVYSGCFTFMEDPEFVIGAVGDDDQTPEDTNEDTIPENNTIAMNLYATMNVPGLVDLAISGNKLCALGASLAIYNVSDSSSPKALPSTIARINKPLGVAIIDSVLVVIDNEGDSLKKAVVYMYDISNSAADPKLLQKQIHSWAYNDFIVNNKCIYLIRGDFLFVRGTDSLLFGRPIDTLKLTGDGNRFTIAGSYLYEYKKTDGTSIYPVINTRIIGEVGSLFDGFSTRWDFDVDVMCGNVTHFATAGANTLGFYKISSDGRLSEINGDADAAGWKMEITSSNYSFYNASADGNIFYVFINGKIMLFKVEGNQYSFTGVSSLEAMGPLIVDSKEGRGVVYIRNLDNIYVAERL